MPFVYEPLRDPGEQIRLVLLHPGEPDDDLRITFHIRSSIEYRNSNVDTELEPRETSARHYEALSYAWGSPEQSAKVFVGVIGSEDAQAVAITESLHVALKHLRSTSDTRLLWIDALCIDQESIGEKNIQVAMMGRIFKCAIKTIVWLGPSDNDSDMAIDYLQYFQERVDHDLEAGITKPTDSCPERDHHYADRSQLMQHELEKIMAMLSFFARPYFSRTWVRQEIRNSKHAVIHCGSKTMEWKDFHKMIKFIETKPATVVPDNSATLLRQFSHSRGNILMLCIATSQTPEIPSLRLDAGRSLCQDPRDKLFASITQEDHPLGVKVKPDYSQPVEELYADVARRCIVENKSLAILQTCMLSTRRLEVPSWTPDWTTALPLEATFHDMCWSACGWIATQVNEFSSNPRICAKGIQVSRVAKVFDLRTGRRDQWSTTLKLLRKFKNRPCGPHPETYKVYDESEWAERVCLALWPGRTAEFFHPARNDSLTLKQQATFLRNIWATDVDYHDLDQDFKDELQWFMRNTTFDFGGLEFFETYNGWVGNGFPGALEGDEICVLLGARCPFILRPCSSLDDAAGLTYEVVSYCSIPGLMEGEAIYGSKLPRSYRPVRLSTGNAVYMLDTETNKLHSAPEVIEGAGMRVDNTLANGFPEVSPESLIAAGIHLADFTLV